ncbi:MAG: hypothetical protein ABJZ55_11815 [Fuerstiella sp.]
MTEPNLTQALGKDIAPLPAKSTDTQLQWWLGGSAFVSWWLYVGLTLISRHFAYEVPGTDRPLLLTLCIFALLFGLYVFQVAIAKQVASRHRPSRPSASQHRQPAHGLAESGARPIETSAANNGTVQDKNTPTQTMLVIIVFSVAFRLLLLFSEPIQEVDAYRYLWDGKVLAAGISPFRYSPEHILLADANQQHPSEVNTLIRLRDQAISNAQILSRVHFGSLTTVYPPVSQAVFAVAAFVTPDSASVQNHLLVIKGLITAFDLATLGVLILILMHVGKPLEWSIAYGWCPLIIKEFANSGHLDSITVFLSIVTVYCALKAFYPQHNDSDSDEKQLVPNTPKQGAESAARRSASRWTFLAAFSLSLAIGAKIYPIILAPLLFLTAWQKVGRMAAIWASIIVLAITIAMVTPMLFREQPDAIAASEQTTTNSLPPLPTIIESTDADTSLPDTNPPLAASATNFDQSLPEETQLKIDQTPPTNPKSEKTGLSAFASQWQMNDFLFLLVAENLRGAGLGSTAWFAITPMQWRNSVIDFMTENSSLSRDQVPFITARLLTGSLFLIIALWLAWKIKHSQNPEAWLRTVFLTIAWFWLLQPTQNPWYWTWALPFVPFARSRAWLAMSGLVLIYYARFWFSYQVPNVAIAGTPYVGVAFFDYVVCWIEFAPWFAWLIWTSIRKGNNAKTNQHAEPPADAP